MARNSIGEENKRKIQKSKRSYYITLPISYVRELGWGEDGQEVVVRKTGRGLFVEAPGSESAPMRIRAGFKLTARAWRKRKQ